MSCNQPVSRNKTAATLETTKDNNDVVAGMSSSSSNSQDHPRCIIGQTQYVEEVKDHNMDLHGNSSYNSTAQHVNLAFKDDIECGIEAASVKEGGSKEASIEQGPKKEEAEEIEESSEDDDAIEFVDVREEILTMKEQFDNLMDVIDNDLFNVAEDVDEDDEDDEDIGQETESHSGSQTSILGSSRGNLLVQILSVVGIGFGHFIDGTVLAYPSPAIPSMQNSTVLNIDKGQESFIRSSFSIGAMAGCLLAGTAMTRLGRRGATMMLTVPAYALGYLLMGSAIDARMMVAGRLMTGGGLGLTLSIPTVYIVEVTSPEFRGALGVVPNLFCQLGIFVTYVPGYYLDWSWLAYTFCILSVCFLVVVWFIPDSPVYLVSRNRMKAASRVLKLLGHDEDRLQLLQDAIVQKQQQQQPDGSPDGGESNADDVTKSRKAAAVACLSTLFTNPDNLKPFLVGVTLMTFFQGTAYPVLIGSAADLFRQSSNGDGGGTIDDQVS